MVERGPEKAGVGGSIPSLATTKSITYKSVSPHFHSNSFQLARRDSPCLEARTFTLSIWLEYSSQPVIALVFSRLK